MKLLPSVPLTHEDYEIWYAMDVRADPQCPPFLRALTADRRDAELILAYEDSKARYIASAGVFAYWEARRLGVDLARRSIP